MMRLTNADSANSIPKTIVVWKSVFSSPRRVWNPVEKLSAPNAPPKLAPVRCNKTAIISNAESTICAYGKIACRVDIAPQDTTKR